VRKIGKVIHLTNRGLVLRAEGVQKLGVAVHDGEGACVGSVLDLFGPIAAPYAVVKPTREASRTSLEGLVGRDLYAGERYGKNRKTKKMPGVQRHKARS
jgi:rRNA processing protein Gar1